MGEFGIRPLSCSDRLPVTPVDESKYSMNTRNEHLDALWMSFSANRDFKKKPRVVSKAVGHHYIADDGRKIYDAFSGLWTSGGEFSIVSTS